jgi:hypothetical protein
MPLTKFQREVALLLAANRSDDSYLAGGAALHRAPNSKRYSNDLDYFHDSEERVAAAFEADREALQKGGFSVMVEMSQRGFIRAVVARGQNATKIEWAHDSAWRFMPPIRNEEVGVQLHPVDLAINKLLALAGRDEPRDFLDILFIHDEILHLGGLIWAAVGKDPGFTPVSLLEIVKRRGKYRPEDFARLSLVEPVDVVANKTKWLGALDEAERFIHAQPPSEAGCLYYSREKDAFVMPGKGANAVPHYGAPGGVLPRILPD